MRVPGHRLDELEHNGERSRAESAWTYRCACGASESASTKAEAKREYGYHLRNVVRAQARAREHSERQALQDRAAEERRAALREMALHVGDQERFLERLRELADLTRGPDLIHPEG